MARLPALSLFHLNDESTTQMSEAVKVPIRHVMVQDITPAHQRKPRAQWPWLIVGVVVFALAALGFLYLERLKEVPKQPADKYQAVFLANGQLYFGRLSWPNSQYVTLQDIYYLQVVQQQLQGQQYSQQTGHTPHVSLVKLGNELHGPEDEMRISRSQILFYEDLKPDSQVVKAIKDYQSKPQSPSTQPQQPPATPSNQ